MNLSEEEALQALLQMGADPSPGVPPFVRENLRHLADRQQGQILQSSLSNPHRKSVAFGAQKHACLTRLDEGLRKQIVDVFVANTNKHLREMVNMPRRHEKGERKADAFTQNKLVKPEVAGVELDGSDEWGSFQLKPIMARDMTLNMTHRGKVFRGKICGTSAHFVFTSILMLMEDLCGDLVAVHVYNLPGAERDAPKVFPEGLEIEVMEPFFKTFDDGSVGIHIDNPKKIRAHPGKPIFAEKDAFDCWKSRGNDAHRSANSKFGHIAALGCYDRALEASDCGVRPEAEEGCGKDEKKKKRTSGGDGLPLEEGETALAFMVKLLSNISLCLHQMGQLHGSACFAAVASVLDEKFGKAQYRLVKAMTELLEQALDPQMTSSRLTCIFATASHASAALQELGVDFHEEVAAVGHRALCKRQKAAGDWADDDGVDAKLEKLGIGAWAAFLIPWESRGISLMQVSTSYTSAEHPPDLSAAKLCLLRQEGKKKFQAKDVEGALHVFMCMFVSVQAQDFCNKASVICSNRSAVHLQRGDVGRALGNAAVSILLSPNGYTSCPINAVLREAKVYRMVADWSRALGAFDRGMRAQSPERTG